MTKENVLKHVEKIGKAYSQKAETNYWSLEDHPKAKFYKDRLPHIRRCYKIIRDGDVLNGLRLLETHVDGIEGNRVRLLIRANSNGFTHEHSWTVENGDLVVRY